VNHFFLRHFSGQNGADGIIGITAFLIMAWVSFVHSYIEEGVSWKLAIYVYGS